MLKLLDSALFKLNRAMAWITAGLIPLMAFAVALDVLGRNLGGFSVAWSAEFSEYGLYLTAVLIAPWLLRRGHHVSVEVLLQILPVRIARWIVVAGDVLLLGICAVLCWYSLAAALRSYQDGSIVIKNVVFPEWWTLVPISFVFAILALEYLLRLLTGRRHEDEQTALL